MIDDNQEDMFDGQELPQEQEYLDTQEELDTELLEDTDTDDTQPEEVEDVVSIGDEVIEDEDDGFAPGTKAPQWVKDLRVENRILKRELKKKNEAPTQPHQDHQETLVLGNKPKIDEFDYDGDAYEAALDNWYAKKHLVEARVARLQAEKDAQIQEHQQKLADYESKKAALRVRDYANAEAVVLDSLTEAQQGIILNGAENPALLVYALGKNEAKAKELGKITDLAKFAFSVSKMESQLKITKKRIPEPEKVVGGGSAASTKNQNSQLEKLRAEAEKTGNFTKVIEFKRRMREK